MGSQLTIQNTVTDPPVSIDIGMMHGSTESGLRGHCGVAVIHIQIQDKDAFGVVAFRGLLMRQRTLLVWIEVDSASLPA